MSRSFINQRLSREKAVQRYLSALEEGDFATIDLVWQEAESNPELEQLLFNLHETFPNGQDLLAWDENALLQKEQTMFQNAKRQIPLSETEDLNPLSSGKRPSVRAQKRWPAPVRTLAAVLFVVFIVGSFLAIHGWNDQHLAPLPTSVPAPSATPEPTHEPLAQLPPLCQMELPALYQKNTSLNNMLVLSNSDIWLVGVNSNRLLALHWNGTKWNNTPVPGPAASSLSSLAALSPDDIWAIGETDYGNGEGRPQPSHTLIEHWNGEHWSQVASPDLLPSTRNLLQGIAAIAPDNVWVAGVAGSDIAKSGYGDNTSPILEHWDGVRWQLVKLSAIQSAGLNSIVALSANDIWAAGASSINDGNNHSPLLIHWNGQSWSQVASQNIDDGVYGQLQKITVDASHHLLVLGVDQSGLPLLLSLNNQWNALPVPQTAAVATGKLTDYNQFWDVFATSTQDIWLAGENVHNPLDGDITFTPLVEHWNGYQWQAVPERYRGQANLQTISVSANVVWSSGFIDDYGQTFLVTTCK